VFGETSLYQLFQLIINICFIYCYGAFPNSPPAPDLEMQYPCVPVFAVKTLKWIVLADRLGKIQERALTKEKIRTGYLDSKVLPQWLKNKIQNLSPLFDLKPEYKFILSLQSWEHWHPSNLFGKAANSNFLSVKFLGSGLTY